MMLLIFSNNTTSVSVSHCKILDKKEEPLFWVTMICLVCSHLLPKLHIFGESQCCLGWWNIWPLTSCRKFQSLAVFQRRKYVHQGGWSPETHQCIIALIEKTWRVPTKFPSNYVEKCHKTRRIKTASKIVPAAFHLDSREHALMAMEKQTTSGAVGRMTNRNMMTAIFGFVSCP